MQRMQDRWSVKADSRGQKKEILKISTAVEMKKVEREEELRRGDGAMG